MLTNPDTGKMTECFDAVELGGYGSRLNKFALRLTIPE